MQVLKVAAKTDARKLAMALYRTLKENHGEVFVQGVGPSAVNQAVKAVAIARGLAAPEGADLKVVPSFAEVEVGEGKKTAIRLRVLWR